jgi:hypothetical protein
LSDGWGCAKNRQHHQPSTAPAVRHLLPKSNDVYSDFTIKGGKLTFRTGDPNLTQRLEAAKRRGEPATVLLLSVSPIQEFVGHLVSVARVKLDPPAAWQVTMRDAAEKPRKPILRIV